MPATILIMAIPVPAAIALSAILVLVLFTPSAVAQNGDNLIFSDKTLGTSESLKYSDPTCGKPSGTFAMQGDCNLVLYGGDWQSNTAHRGKQCTLKLQNDGRLVVTGGDGRVLWRSGASSSQGYYAAVLHPNPAFKSQTTQSVAITVYGPAIWSTHNGKLVDLDSLNETTTTHLGYKHVRMGNSLLVDNALFSGQILYGDGALTADDESFAMQGDCNLVLYANPGWQSNTHGNGHNCFLRLDFNGGLTILDDNYKTVWTNHVSSTAGPYVAILQPDGDLVVYGPAIWTTAGRHIGASAQGDMIKQVTQV